MGPIFEPIVKDRHENMKEKSYIYLLVIGVAAKFQGRGFGGKIMQVLIEKCEKLGIHLYLETEVERNVEIYKRYGFKVIKQVSPYVGYDKRSKGTQLKQNNVSLLGCKVGALNG